MTSRAGRHLAYFGFAALIGAGGQASPAAAQSYLADNSSAGNVTVDYSVLGGGMGGGYPAGTVTRGALPGGTCSCANSPLGVIAAPPRPTFNNPFNANLAMAQPAVPPGFMTYAQVTGAPSYVASNGAVTLHPPTASQPQPQMADMTPPTPTPAPAVTETENTPAPTTPAEPAGTQTAELPKTTKTQSAPAATGTEGTTATTTTGDAGAPTPPDAVPTEVPSPVGPNDAVANVSQAPATATPPTETPTTNTQSTDATTTPPAATDTTTNTQGTEAATATPPVEPSTTQQAAVTPPAPEGTTPPAEGAAPNSGAAVPQGGYRILYTGDSDDVPGTSTGDLDKVAADMTSDQNKRIQILAYAAGTEDTESKARRKSLARGLAIRSYLIKAGVPSTRIDVRALGSKADGGPADRVDIVPAS